MASVVRWARHYFLRPPSPRRSISSNGFVVLDSARKIEEERYAWYTPENWYPVRIGEVFKDQYQVLSKLGYGAYSTVWLCRDLKAHSYVALKVGERNSTQCRREVDVYNHIRSCRTSHVGASLIRSLLDEFEIAAKNGSYQCLVHEPCDMSLASPKLRLSDGKMSEEILKLTVIHLLLLLDFLHTEAKVIHADLKPKNVMLAIDDESILAELDQREQKTPSARKLDGDRVIHTSQQFARAKYHGRPRLCDFGEARFGKQEYEGDIQPWLFRAPEVVLDLPWNNKVDIWNLGVMIWHMFENKHLFDTRDEKGECTNTNHVAEMVALLGPPPVDFVNKSRFADRYFDSEGKWIGGIEIPTLTLETAEGNLEGGGKALFLKFMRKMLRWKPSDRQTAEELLEDPWLNSPTAAS